VTQAYYVVIEHRNHLIVMSHLPVAPEPSTGIITYDFRVQQSYIDDPNGFGFYVGQKVIASGVFAMYGANSDQQATADSDTDINLGDRITWEADNGVFGEYLYGDHNLNGDVNFNDHVIQERNNGVFSSVPR
jgi:hypothetical protein